MGQISSPELQSLADEWSPIVLNLLDQMGATIWPAKKIRRSLFAKPEFVIRYNVEGPTQQGRSLVWALFHTSRPSAFDDWGVLQKGEREFWLVMLNIGTASTFSIEGAQSQHQITVSIDALTRALEQAEQSGPKVEQFFGNKGPLSHRVSTGK